MDKDKKAPGFTLGEGPDISAAVVRPDTPQHAEAEAKKEGKHDPELMGATASIWPDLMDGAPGEARPQEDGTPAATTNLSVGGGASLAETIATSPLTSLERRIREKLSPLLRRLAREQGVELACVAGICASARATKEDLFRHV